MEEEEKNLLSMTTRSLDTNHSLVFTGVSVCQIMLSFVMVNVCHTEDFKMSLLVDCINPSLSQVGEIPLS